MIRIILALPLLLVMVIFALSNPQPVQLKFWPTDYSLEVPLSIAVFVGMGAAFFLGALALWFAAMAARARAGRAEREARRLREEVAALQARLDVPVRSNVTIQPATPPALPAPQMALIGQK